MKAQTKEILIFAGINISVLLLCLIGLIWSDWELIMSYGIGMVFGGISYFLFYLTTKPENDSTKIYIFAILRYLLMFLGIGLPALIISLTGTDASSKLRFLNILAAGVPFLINVALVGRLGKEQKQ